jgi:hypothetical protein
LVNVHALIGIARCHGPWQHTGTSRMCRSPTVSPTIPAVPADM